MKDHTILKITVYCHSILVIAIFPPDESPFFRVGMCNSYNDVPAKECFVFVSYLGEKRKQFLLIVKPRFSCLNMKRQAYTLTRLSVFIIHLQFLNHWVIFMFFNGHSDQILVWYFKKNSKTGITLSELNGSIFQTKTLLKIVAESYYYNRSWIIIKLFLSKLFFN